LGSQYLFTPVKLSSLFQLAEPAGLYLNVFFIVLSNGWDREQTGQIKALINVFMGLIISPNRSLIFKKMHFFETSNPVCQAHDQ